MSGEQICHLYWLREGAEDEYERRHTSVWPALSALLDTAGIYDYRYSGAGVC